MTATISARDIYWVQIDGVEEDKVRICVITRVTSTYIEIVYGQGTPNPNTKYVAVKLGTRDAIDFGISKDTFFRAENVVLVHPSRVRAQIGRCSPLKWLDIEELRDEAYAEDRVVAEVQGAATPKPELK